MSEWLTTKDVAEKAGLSYHTLKNYVYRNLNEVPKPDQHFGRTPVWKEETINDWVDNRRRLKPKEH
jgi:predicted DNA-binding transcriptional regulator AlpA